MDPFDLGFLQPDNMCPVHLGSAEKDAWCSVLKAAKPGTIAWALRSPLTAYHK
jgi:hypothetical protein